MIKCNRRCGAMDLNWKVINGNYKLFGNDDLIHICNDGVLEHLKLRKKVTAKILNDLQENNTNDKPDAETHVPTFLKKHVEERELFKDNPDPAKMFTITTTAIGIAITGDDKNNPIYLPKVAIPEIVKALVDFIC